MAAAAVCRLLQFGFARRQPKIDDDAARCASPKARSPRCRRKRWDEEESLQISSFLLNDAGSWDAPLGEEQLPRRGSKRHGDPLQPPFRLVFEATPEQLRCRAPAAFREKYLARLSAGAEAAAWLPRERRSSRSATVTILDWDDTLFCTTQLALVSCPLTTRQLQALALSVKALLEECLRRGKTFIVTNAGAGWVQRSTFRYMPEVLPMLDQVHIISARAKFERIYPGNPREWKQQAFIEISRYLDLAAINNIVAVGDCEHELEAAENLARQLPEAVCKVVKLREKPLAEELCAEQQWLIKDLRYILEQPVNARISYERRPRSCP